MGKLWVRGCCLTRRRRSSTSQVRERSSGSKRQEQKQHEPLKKKKSELAQSSCSLHVMVSQDFQKKAESADACSSAGWMESVCSSGGHHNVHIITEVLRWAIPYALPCPPKSQLGFPWMYSLLPSQGLTDCKGCCLHSLPLSLKSPLLRLALDRMTAFPCPGASWRPGAETPMRRPEACSHLGWQKLNFQPIPITLPSSWSHCGCEDLGPANILGLVSQEALRILGFAAGRWALQRELAAVASSPAQITPEGDNKVAEILDSGNKAGTVYSAAPVLSFSHTLLCLCFSQSLGGSYYYMILQMRTKPQPKGIYHCPTVG